MPRRHPKPAQSARGAKAGRRPAAPREDPAREAELEARRRETCARKARYATDAEARAFDLMHNPGPARQRASTYHCPICDGWHFTRG